MKPQFNVYVNSRWTDKIYGTKSEAKAWLGRNLKDTHMGTWRKTETGLAYDTTIGKYFEFVLETEVDLRPHFWHENNTLCSTWFERDRAMVRLTDTRDNEIICLWDQDVENFVLDGFKNIRQSWHEALAEYATSLKLRAERKK